MTELGVTENGDEAAGSGFVGVDVGGTHTDIHVVLGERETRAKALTTYDDFSRGVLEALEVAADSLGITRQELLGDVQLLVNATTVVTNAITELRGSTVGVLVTSGFRDEFRFGGGPRKPDFDDHVQSNIPDLVKRWHIAEVGGRLDRNGAEVAPLDRLGVEEATRRLVEDGVKSIAICFLSSYASSAHEDEAAAIVAELYPDLFVTTSSSLSSVRGEYRRWITAVLNCFVFEHAEVFVDTLGVKLSEAGLDGTVAFFQGLGGGISQERAKQFPLALLGAGPAAGVTGAAALAARMGYSSVLLGDMGGTSFDTGVVHEGEIHVQKEVQVGRFRTALTLVDVVSVGAGGGSIAWISERGAPQVGPRSAGSTPGPAAYGRGGEEPTVTDAMVTMGFIDPDNYLGGRVRLHRDLAERALREKFADVVGWGLEEAASAVYELVVANMATAVREVSVMKGYDPRDFLFFAYGGTLPWFAAEIAATLGIDSVLIPNNSSVFCARGLLVSDFVMRDDQTVQLPLATPEEIEELNAIGEGMVSSALEEMRAEGFPDQRIEIDRIAEIQYMGQTHALPVTLPDRALEAADVPRLSERFTELYERSYGKGTAWLGVPTTILNYGVRAVGKLPRAPFRRYDPEPAERGEMQVSERRLYLPRERQVATVPIIDEAKFTSGSEVAGPALIEAIDTTIYVPRGNTARRDEFANILLEKEGS